MQKFLAMAAVALFVIAVGAQAEDGAKSNLELGVELDIKEVMKSEMAVKLGTYRDMTIWRKLKLGTAAYVNPTLLKTAAVGYAYVPEAFSADNAKELFKSVVAGKMMAATVDVGQVYVIPPDKMQTMAGIPETPKAFAKWLKSFSAEMPDVIFVGSSPVSCGVTGAPLVAWNTYDWTPSQEWQAYAMGTFADDSVEEVEPEQIKDR